MSSTRTAIILVEHVIWCDDTAWIAAVHHLAERFARAAPLDPHAVESAGALHEQLELLARWASEGGIDLDRELGRWFDEHLALHLRPDPTTTRAVRALAQDYDLHAASALPPRAAESIARHAGCWRSFTGLHGDVRSADALADLTAQLGSEVLVANSPTPLPAGANPAALNARS